MSGSYPSAGNGKTLSPDPLEELARVLGDMVRAEDIKPLLKRVGVQELGDEKRAKWRRFNTTLQGHQRRIGNLDPILKVIQSVADKQRFVRAGGALEFEEFRAKINSFLMWAGLEYQPNGSFSSVPVPKDLLEAEKRVEQASPTVSPSAKQPGIFIPKLHPDIHYACADELSHGDYFHAGQEAWKWLMHRLREKVGSQLDGMSLLNYAFDLHKEWNNCPRLMLSDYTQPSGWNEHTGFVELFRSCHHAFRNPTSHTPRQQWGGSDDEAIHWLTTISRLRDRLDPPHAILYPVPVRNA